MTGLLLKDLFVITKQLALFLFIVPILAMTGGTSLFVMVIFLGATFPMTSIAYDERSKWNELAIMMPYSRKELILSKYVLGYIGIFSISILLIISQTFLQLKEGTLSGIDFQIIIVGILLSLAFIAINMPVLFQFGVEKGRYFLIIVFALIGSSGRFLMQSMPFSTLSFKNFSLLSVILLVILLNVVSIQLSSKIRFRNK